MEFKKDTDPIFIFLFSLCCHLISSSALQAQALAKTHSDNPLCQGETELHHSRLLKREFVKPWVAMSFILTFYVVLGYTGFPGVTSDKESTYQCRRCKRYGLGRSPEEGTGNPLQYFCLKNSMYRGAWQATSIGHSQTWLKWLSTHACIADEQCCGSFRWKAKGLSYTHTCIHSPPNLPSARQPGWHITLSR